MSRAIQIIFFLLVYLTFFSTAQAADPVTSRISVDSYGNGGNGGSHDAVISRNNRFVAFMSRADNLVPNDNNGYRDVFVHDQQTGQTSRVSVDSSGNGGLGYSDYPVISGDGRYVAFESYVSTLVPDDTNGKSDIFVYDRQTGQPSRVSINSNGVQGNVNSYNPSISEDGRYVAFSSYAFNLVSNDSNGMDSDIFVHDRQTGQTTIVSVDSHGNQGDGDSHYPVISRDGRYVAFVSEVNTLVSGDTNGQRDVFIHDRQTDQTTRVNVDSFGNQSIGISTQDRKIALSGDSRYVAFESWANDLVSGDTNNYTDIFVHDRVTGQTIRVSVDSNGNEGYWGGSYPSITDNGRYVAFNSSSQLVPEDIDSGSNVYIHDQQTGQTSQIQEADGFSPFISSDGSYVAFLAGSDLLPGGNVYGEDVFMRGPLEIDNACPFAPVLLGAYPYYFFFTIQSAYDFISTSGIDLIQIQSIEFPETLVFDQDVRVTLKGGYDCDYYELPYSFPTVRSMTINSGSIVVDKIIIQ